MRLTVAFLLKLARSEVRLRASRERRGSALTFQAHADAEALLKATEGASFPLGLVYFTLLVLRARVSLVVLHGSLEEALMNGERAKKGLKAAH